MTQKLSPLTLKFHGSFRLKDSRRGKHYRLDGQVSQVNCAFTWVKRLSLNWDNNN